MSHPKNNTSKFQSWIVMAVVAIVIIVAIVVMQQPTQPKGNIVEMKTPVTDVGKIDPTQIP